MSEGATKNCNIKSKISTEDRINTTSEINSVFLPGSETPSKKTVSVKTALSRRVKESITTLNSICEETTIDIQEANLLTRVKQEGEFVESTEVEYQSVKSGSKESDCAIGSRKENYKTCTNFDSDSLYWNQDSKESLLNFIDKEDNNLLPVETEAQDDPESQSSGCLFDTTLMSDPIMSEPFYEEYLDLKSLFPDLESDPLYNMFSDPIYHKLVKDKQQPAPVIEGAQPVPETAPVEETTFPPSPEIMKEIDNLLADADLSKIDQCTVNELLNVEVIDEAPTDLDHSDVFSSCISSPGSMDSVSTELNASDSSITAELQLLLETLENADKQELKTIKSQDLLLECSTSKPSKRKADASESAPATKRAKPSTLNQQEQADKSTARRIKNNIASRHCRASRRQREQDLFAKEEELMKSNAELKAQLEQLMQETEALRKVLIQRLSGVSVVG